MISQPVAEALLQFNEKPLTIHQCLRAYEAECIFQGYFGCGEFFAHFSHCSGSIWKKVVKTVIKYGYPATVPACPAFDIDTSNNVINMFMALLGQVQGCITNLNQIMAIADQNTDGQGEDFVEHILDKYSDLEETLLEIIARYKMANCDSSLPQFDKWVKHKIK